MSSMVNIYTSGILSPMTDRSIGTLLRMANDLTMFGFLTRPTIQDFDNLGPFEAHVLYALVHEPCYLSG